MIGVGCGGDDGDSKLWAVNKFGGTSVASAEAMCRVRDIVMEQMDRRNDVSKMAVVVSAMGGKPKVTDLLLSCVTQAAAQDQDGYEALLKLIHRKHTQAVDLLCLSSVDKEAFVCALDRDMADIKDLLRAVALMRHENSRLQELVSGYGELWSCQILCAALNKNNVGRRFEYLNARRVLIVADQGHNAENSPGPEIDWRRTKANMDAYLSGLDQSVNGLVITGFVASTKEGVATTLQRDGSDYTASVFGRLLSASAVQIWTDVDGVLSADPRKVPEAKVLQEVSFNEAMELAYFGAKVIHPKTMQPAVTAGIPIFIRNTFNPSFPGTRIFTSSTATKDRIRCVCGFSTMDNISLLNLEGSGMVGVPGVAQRLFAALHGMGISIILISQASSEHSISVAMEASVAEVAAAGVKEAFDLELRQGMIGSVDIISPCCIVAAVGDGMSDTTGVAGRFFSALGRSGINVLAIAQGCSERNISCVVKQSDGARALRTVHAAFLLSHMTVSVGLIGGGTAGDSLLGMLDDQRQVLKTQFNVDLQIRAVANAEKMLLSENSINLSTWVSSLDSPPGVEEERVMDLSGKSDSQFGMPGALSQPPGLSGGSRAKGETTAAKMERAKSVLGIAQGVDVSAMLDHLQPIHLPHSVVIDCSPANEMTQDHSVWLARGIHVVSSNRLANGGPLNLYHELLMERERSTGLYLYETTVGGALPIISTLQNLRSAGDEVLRVEGVLNVFISFVFNRLSPALGSSEEPVPFSKACWEAAEQGLMDKDVTQALSCADQRQIVLILGRELGLELEEEHVHVEPLLEAVDGAGGGGGGGNDVLSRVSALDDVMRRRAEEAHARGNVLRYMCRVDVEEGKASAGIREVEARHAFAGLEGAAFCAVFFTKRMGAPLIVQAPMGGPKTIASGLFADLLRVCTSLGARDRGHSHMMRSNSFTS